MNGFNLLSSYKPVLQSRHFKTKEEFEKSFVTARIALHDLDISKLSLWTFEDLEDLLERTKQSSFLRQITKWLRDRLVPALDEALDLHERVVRDEQPDRYVHDPLFDPYGPCALQLVRALTDCLLQMRRSRRTVSEQRRLRNTIHILKTWRERRQHVRDRWRDAVIARRLQNPAPL